MKRDYIVTLLVMLGVMTATVLIYRLSQTQFGTQGFAEISLTKRIAAFLVPVLAVGMGVGIPREVARINGTEMEIVKYEILRNSLLITFVIMACLFIAVCAFSDLLAELFFGERKYYYLMFPMSISVQGSMLNSVAYSYFRGLNRFPIANYLQAINLILCPIIVILLLSKDIPSYLTVWGILCAFVSLAFLSREALNRQGKLLNYRLLLKVTHYSVRRLPGDIALQAMFVFPPILSAHLSDFKTAGDVAFSLTLLTLVMVPLSPLSTILLPKVMRLLSDGNTQSLLRMTGKQYAYVAIGAAILSAGLCVGAEKGIQIVLPGRNDFDFTILRASAVAVLPYSTYIYLRTFIDALHEKAHNSVNCVASLGVLLFTVAVSLEFTSASMGLAFGLILGFYSLGLLSYKKVRQDRSLL